MDTAPSPSEHGFDLPPEGTGLPVGRADLGGRPHPMPGADVHVEPFADGAVYADRNSPR